MKITKNVLKKLPPRRRESHKGDYGRILVVAGSAQYPGAAVLTSWAAETILRSGADYVHVLAPGKVGWVVNTYLPDLIVTKVRARRFTKRHVRKVISMEKDYDVLLIGPGLGERSIPFAREIIQRWGKPKVVDADALKGVDLTRVENCILTPHMKELETILHNNGIQEQELQEHLGTNVILRKGPTDLIMSSTEEGENRTGNAVMTKAGTGDVLAGLAAGLLAQTGDLFDAACLAAWINGATGDLLERRKGRTFIASDIPQHMHEVMR